MKKKAFLFAVISALLFFLYFLLDDFIYSSILSGDGIVETLLNPVMWLFEVPIIVFSIMLVLQKKNVVMLCSWLIYAAFSAITYVNYIKSYCTWHGSLIFNVEAFSYFFEIAYLVIMTVILLLVCLPKLKKYLENMAFLPFIPMILFAGSWIIQSSRGAYARRYFIQGFSRYPWPVIISASIKLLEVLAVVFLCLWVWQGIDRSKKIKVSTAAAETAPKLSDADKLLQYKELLDSGAISQEEFDDKKKQILN